MKKQFLLYFMVGTMTASCLNLSCARSENNDQKDQAPTHSASDTISSDMHPANVDTSSTNSATTSASGTTPLNTDGTH